MIPQSVSGSRTTLHLVRLHHRSSVASASASASALVQADVRTSPSYYFSSHNTSSPHHDISDSNQLHQSNPSFQTTDNYNGHESTLGNGRISSHKPRNENISNRNKNYGDNIRHASSLSPSAHQTIQPKLRRNQHRASIYERPRWRDNQKVTRSETRIGPKKQINVASTEWIQVSSTPPMSKLSDLFPSLNQIIEFELQKGIIDLDVLERLKHDSGASHTAAFRALGELDASNSLYTTEKINDDNPNIPLWTPASSSNSPDAYPDNYPIVQEARIQLSYRAQPVGWFLRLPCRSVVNAVLNHVRLANKQLLNSVQLNNLKQDRKKWRECLWKGVYADYESLAEKKDMRSALDKEHHDEKELMWGYGKLGQDIEDNSVLESSVVGESDTATTFDDDRRNDEGNDYLQSYMQRHPFPSQLMNSSSYRPLKSGSTIVSVREFSPYLADVALSDKKHVPWEQHAFHLSPLLNISDSVVRVETSDLNVSEEDIQYLFRGYDLKSIPESTELTTLPSGIDKIIESLGWNVQCNGNADMLVHGKHAPYERGSERGHTKGAPNRANRNTFLVRFSSPAEARMAVRDTNGQFIREYGERLQVTLFPSSGLG